MILQFSRDKSNSAGMLKSTESMDFSESEVFRGLQGQLQLLDQLLGQLPDPVFVFDDRGKHRYVNRSAAELFGQSTADWIDKNWEEVGLPPSLAQSFRSWSKPVFTSRSFVMTEQTLPTIDGPRIFECLLRPLFKIQDTPLAMSCLRDITDRKRADQEAKSALMREMQLRKAAELASKRSQQLLALALSLSEALTASEVADLTLTQAITSLDAHGGEITLLNDEGELMEHLSGASTSTSSELIQLHHRIPFQADGPIIQAAKTRTPVWMESEFALVARFPALSAWVNASQTRAMACLPLIVDGHAIGSMSLQFSQCREFSHDDQAFAITLARQCGQAILRARGFKKDKNQIEKH